MFGRCAEQSPGRQLANHYWPWFSDSHSLFKSKLRYVGFIWLLEGVFKQERCFDYVASTHDFLNNTKGFSEAAMYYYKKSPEQLSYDEQLEMMLRL